MKCVMIINQDLPTGLIANTSAVLGVSIGDKFKEIVGEDVWDRDNKIHRGITQVSIPLLKGDSDAIASIRNKLLQNGSDEIYFVDFCDVAQKSKTYDEYKSELRQTATDQLNYLGIAIYGSAKKVSKLSGSFSLLR